MPPPGLLGAAGFGHPADKSGFGRGAHLAGSAGQIWANRKSAEAPPRPLTPPRTDGQVELALGKELDFLSQVTLALSLSSELCLASGRLTSACHPPALPPGSWPAVGPRSHGPQR